MPGKIYAITYTGFFDDENTVRALVGVHRQDEAGRKTTHLYHATSASAQRVTVYAAVRRGRDGAVVPSAVGWTWLRRENGAIAPMGGDDGQGNVLGESL